VRGVAFDATDPAQVETALGALPPQVDVTANVIAPGSTRDTEFFRGGMTEQRRSALIAQTANGRAGTPADIAATVVFLASPGASHITAQTLHVNGGALGGRYAGTR
jgi:3-oxoacyl-[acyl-carrier protein] reductase